MSSSASSHPEPLPLARRISIVGPSGSGKSVLSRTLAEKLSLPHVELDQLRHAHSSDADPDAEFVRLVTARTADPAWIMDGHYRLVRETIWHRADLIIWLNYPLGFVLLRLAGRFVARLTIREGSSEGVSSVPSASWARRFGRLTRTVRERREYRRLLTAAARRGAILVELRSEAETRAWLGLIEAGDHAGR